MGFKNKKQTKKMTLKEYLYKYLFITFGTFIVAFSLEGFLLPNNIIDGGIIGISMMTSYVTNFNLGVLIVLLNLPFLYLAYNKMGKMFIANILYATSMLGIFVNSFHHLHVTEIPLLATVFGGILLGIGVGLILRNDAALDGTEILALRLVKKSGFSVGEIVMFFNLFIYTAAGFLYGWDNSMYSIMTYFIAYRVIDIVINGLNTSKSVIVISENAKEIGQAIMKELDISITYQKGKGGYSGQEKIIVYCVVARLEFAKMKKLVKSIDPTAFLVVQDVTEVEGIRIKKK